MLIYLKNQHTAECVTDYTDLVFLKYLICRKQRICFVICFLYTNVSVVNFLSNILDFLTTLLYRIDLGHLSSSQHSSD